MAYSFMTFYQNWWSSRNKKLCFLLISWSSKNGNFIVQSLHHVDVNLKPRFLIKSGYYIVPSPFTALFLMSNMKFKSWMSSNTRCPLFLELSTWLLEFACPTGTPPISRDPWMFSPSSFHKLFSWPACLVIWHFWCGWNGQCIRPVR